MNLKKLTQQAKKLADKRGGTETLKEDLAELKGVAAGKGSLKDKAKAAAEVLKEPGQHHDAAAAAKPEDAAPQADSAPTPPA